MPNRASISIRTQVGMSTPLDRNIPYRLLWIKVIMRATYDYVLWKDSSKFGLRKCALEAERWLFGPSTLVNSFENICYLFDLSPDKFREYARTLTPDDVRKLEYVDRQGRAPQALPEAESPRVDGDDR